MLLHDRMRASARTEDLVAFDPPRVVMPSEAVVLAAGAGTRIRTTRGAPPKPLTPVLGRTLIERSIRAFSRAGVSRVTVIVGFEAQPIVDAVERIAPEYGVEARAVENPRWERGNGTSVFAAAGHVEGPFYLAMGDHLFDPAVLRTLAGADDGAPLALAVDHEYTDLADLPEATKVRLAGRRIVEIGKEIPRFDAVDTGVFLCRSGVFDALERADAEGDGSLTGAVRVLARRRAAFTVPVTGLFWQDVDTPEDLALAERRLRLRRQRSALGPEVSVRP